MCQGCVDEGLLSQSTYDKIETFLDKYPDAEFGPAHIVLSDCNLEDEYIKYCLKDIEKGMAVATTSELQATKIFLLELLAVPESQR